MADSDMKVPIVKVEPKSFKLELCFFFLNLGLMMILCFFFCD